MAITQTITVLPTPPSRADPANFDTRADSFLSALPTMQTQMNTWAGQANSTASDATGAAGDAEAAQAAAEAAQGTATTQAGIATTQAGIATTQAGTATTQAGTATTQAGIATTQAGIATTQAGIATTKAGEAAASAALAVDVVSGGLTSTTPVANKIPLADGAAKIALGWLDLTGYASSSHAHGNITAAGAIGSTANLPVITTTSGALTVGAFGTGATNFTAGNDARLSDARTPTAHNQAETTITFTDVSTGNASTTAHGFAPKATAPASGLRSVLAIDNGETARSDKALFDATNPAALGTAAPGSAMTAARRDHVHALPSLGKILQVVSATTTTEVTVASGTYTAIGLSATLTPSSSSSKVLLIASFSASAIEISGDPGTQTELRRGATVLANKPWAPRSDSGKIISDVSFVYLDSPASASEVTYSLHGRVADYSSGKSVIFHEDGGFGSLIALEVAG